DAHLPVDTALFRQVPDAVLRFERRTVSQHRQLAGIRKQNRHDHPDRRRLAGAVRPDETVERAAGDDELEVRHGPGGAERLVDLFERNRVVHGDRIYRTTDVRDAGYVLAVPMKNL